MFSRTLQKTWENTCDGVPRKAQAATYRERSSSKVISCEIYEIFQSSFFLEQLSVNVSFSRVGLAQPYQNFKYLVLLTKQICTSYK